MTMNQNDKVRVINSVTGGAATVPRWQLDHPVFGKCLVEVKEGTKPHTPELYRSQTPEEYSVSHPAKLHVFDGELHDEIAEAHKWFLNDHTDRSLQWEM